jgi:uncharacterized protein involved in exopolysaccharide biosynthesis
MARRRKALLLIPPVLVTIVCVVGAYMLPRKYESATTIWVQRDEILNPLVSFTMAVQMASEDRLETFNEIVMSRRTIEIVIDSLRLAPRDATGIQRDELISRVRSSIRTDKRGSDSFSITFIDSDPVRAQRTVTLLAEIFIRTRLLAETRRNTLTVEFFERKLKEYQEKFGENEEAVVSLLKQRIQELPTGSRVLAGRFDAIESKIRETEERVRTYQRAQADLGLFPDAFRTEHGRQALTELQRMNLPFGDDLRKLVGQYEDLTSRYTTKYPEVGRLEIQILALLKKLRGVLQSELTFQASQLLEFRKSRDEAIDEIMHSTVVERTDQDQESNYALYRQLYNDMKVKLEQARTAQELGKNAENAFIIIDPARIPAKPTRPNRMLIILGGIGVGILLGLLSAGAAELLDSTIRTPRDLEVYEKPIIALLPEARLAKRYLR